MKQKKIETHKIGWSAKRRRDAATRANHSPARTAEDRACSPE
jgi:hypothetical protein